MSKNSNGLDQYFRSKRSVAPKKIMKNTIKVTDSPQNERILFLEKEILRHQDLYYNKTPEISDSEFDLLVNRLRKLSPKNPVLKLVGKDSSKLYDKVEHIIPMNSQGKANEVSEFLAWARKHKYPKYLV